MNLSRDHWVAWLQTENLTHRNILLNFLRSPNKPILRKNNHRIMQIMELSWRSAYKSFELFERVIDAKSDTKQFTLLKTLWHQNQDHNHQEYLANPIQLIASVPPIEFSACAVDHRFVSHIFNKFSGVSLPILNQIQSEGLDGGFYELELERGVGYSVRFQWWVELFEDWKPMNEAVHTVIHLFDQKLTTDIG